MAMVRTDEAAILKNVLNEDADGVNGAFLEYIKKNSGKIFLFSLKK